MSVDAQHIYGLSKIVKAKLICLKVQNFMGSIFFNIFNEQYISLKKCYFKNIQYRKTKPENKTNVADKCLHFIYIPSDIINNSI